MNRDRPIDIDPERIERFLVQRGWVSRTYRGNLLRIWLPGTDQEGDIEVFLSKDAKPSTRAAEMQAALTTISQVYETSIGEITVEIEALGFDSIRSRIPDEYVRGGAIELKVASSYIDQMRELLVASATTVLTGAKHYRRAYKEAIEYAAQCRFGHTFRGSFGIVVESPLTPNIAPLLDLPDNPVPFSRKVVNRIACGLSSLSTAVQRDDPGPLLTPDSGLSANMCDEIVGLLEDSELGRVYISIHHSGEWPVGEGIQRAAAREFAVERSHLDLLRSASATLRGTQDATPETVVGRILRLEADGNPQDLARAAGGRESIVVNWDSADYGLIKVQIDLSPADYLVAIDAHKNGNLVAIAGELKQRGRRWHLNQPKQFRTLPLG